MIAQRDREEIQRNFDRYKNDLEVQHSRSIEKSKMEHEELTKQRMHESMRRIQGEAERCLAAAKKKSWCSNCTKEVCVLSQSFSCYYLFLFSGIVRCGNSCLESLDGNKQQCLTVCSTIRMLLKISCFYLLSFSFQYPIFVSFLLGVLSLLLEYKLLLDRLSTRTLGITSLSVLT